MLVEKKSPMYYLMYTIFIVSFILLTYFGVGPVVFADGNISERILTAVIVLLIYFAWGFLFARWKRSYR